MKEPYIVLLSIYACISIILKIFTHNRTCWCLRACVCVCERVDLLKIIFKQNVNNLTICCIPNPKRECACASDSGNCRQSAIATATATAVIAAGKQYRKQQQRKTLATLTHTRSTHIHKPRTQTPALRHKKKRKTNTNKGSFSRNWVAINFWLFC